MRELYPPVLPSYIPAFDYTQKAIIPFKLSSYNSISQVAQVHVIVRNQTDNRSALATTFLNEIASVNFGVNEDITGSSEYPCYVEINPATFFDSGFQLDRIYKVQLRLSEITLPFSPSAADLSQNLDRFSEWSTVCLLKPIQKPNIYISEFTSTASSSTANDSTYVFSAGDAVFNWGYEGYNGEVINTYRLKLYQGTTLLKDSGDVTVNTYNITGDNASGYYDFELQLDADLEFKLEYYTTTKNGFESLVSYNFNTVQAIKSDFIPTITTEIDEEEGFASVHVTGQERVNVILTLRRASSKDNFSKWVDMTNLTLKSVYPDFTYQDFTIESGVVYQYGVQVRDNNRRRSTLIKSNYVSGIFEHSYLLAHNGGLTNTTKQLKLKFNTTISSFGTTVLESRSETIGSKYPFIARNGNTYYRTFSLSGLVTHFMDDGKMFTSHSEIYGNAEDYINALNENRRYGTSVMLHNEDEPETGSVKSSYLYSEMYDYTYERDFREKVMEFLYEDKVRLFKSATEGNILVRLMEVSFTPRQELGRMVYDFSATAVEVDDPTIENLRKYEIHYINPYVADLSYSEDIIGQLSSFDYTFYDGIDINSEIQKRHHIGENVNGVHYISGVIKYLRIEFDSEPYLIDKSTMQPADYVINENNAASGWLINYGGTPILVMWPNNVYEFKDDNVNISSATRITFPKKVSATVDYVISLVEEPQEASIVIQELEYEYRVGQLFDTFNSMFNFINTIYYRYTFNNEQYTQGVNSVKMLDIEADPGTIIYIRQEGDTKLWRLVMNFSGVLHLDPEEESMGFIDGYFYGVNIAAAQLNKNIGQVTKLPATAAQFDYCTFDNVMYIYRNGKWSEAVYHSDDNSYDVKCSVDAIVNYYLQTVRKIYG